MPIYGYRCGQCGHELEVLQSMSEPPLKVCPECGGPLNKMLYPVGVHFKGSGFYSTDYKSNGSGAKKEGKSESDSGTSDSATSESATKTESTGSSDKKPESSPS